MFDKKKDLSHEVFKGYVSTAICVWNIGEEEYIQRSNKLVNIAPTVVMLETAKKRKFARQKKQDYQRSEPVKKRRKKVKWKYIDNPDIES